MSKARNKSQTPETLDDEDIQVGKALSKGVKQASNKAGRNYLITLRPSDDKPFDNPDIETAKIKEYVESFKEIKFGIIGREKNYVKNYISNGKKDKHPEFMKETGTYHYHILVSTNNSAKIDHLKVIEAKFADMFPTQLKLSDEETNNLKAKGQVKNPAIDVVFANTRDRNTVSYCAKEDMNPLLIGDITREKLNNTLQITSKEKALKKKKFRDSKEREDAMVKFVDDLMKEHDIKVNYYTGEFMNLGDEKEFVRFLKSHGFLEVFRIKDMEEILRWTRNRTLCSSIFPFYNPNLSMYKYSDCYLDLKNNRVLSLEEGKAILDEEGTDPVVEFEEQFTREYPLNWISYIEQFPKAEDFRKHFREVLLPAVRGGKCIYIHGLSGSGKSVTYNLFRHIFRNVMRDQASEGKFTWASIAPCPKFGVDEADIFSKSTGLKEQNQWKRILNGDEITVCKKGEDQTISVMKNGVLTSNDPPESPYYSGEKSEHFTAIARRLNPHERNTVVVDEDPTYMDTIKGEASKIVAYHMIDDEE